MGIVVDLIIIIGIILCMFFGYKKGLTGSLIKLLSFAIAVVVALMFYKPLAKSMIDNTVIDDNIHSAIVETLNKNETVQSEENKKENTNLIQNIEDNIKKQADQAKNEIIEQTANEATQTVVYAGSLLVLFVGARIALMIISIFVKQVTKLPIIKQVDKTGGIIYGLVEGIVIVYVVLAVISLLSVVISNNVVATAVEDSYIGSLLYNNNIILKFFL